MSEYVDFFIWILEEFEVLFMSRLPRRLHGDHWEIRESLFSRCLQDIVDLGQVLIRFISENDRPASAFVIGRVQEMTRRRWMLGKASSSQSPIANKKLFGSSLSVDCQSVFHLCTSFPSDLGNEMSFSQYAFYCIIQL